MLIIWEKIGAFKNCVHQGFSQRGDAYDISVGPKSRRIAGWLSPILHPYLLELLNSYISLRQASEWGMRGLQDSFQRFMKRLTSYSTKRKNIIQSIILVHNFRTQVIDCSFDPEYQRVIVLQGNDHINCYFHHELE